MKLPVCGKSGNLLTWLADFLHMRLQVVRLNNIYSHTVSETSGVPLPVLGPTLFLLITNDVSNILEKLDGEFNPQIILPIYDVVYVGWGTTPFDYYLRHRII